jgi:hypothetical protein
MFQVGNKGLFWDLYKNELTFGWYNKCSVLRYTSIQTPARVQPAVSSFCFALYSRNLTKKSPELQFAAQELLIYYNLKYQNASK